tara:strand:+ start:90 stop:284 length:195 start_codon:yes stop_codon:yes gene_type:complete
VEFLINKKIMRLRGEELLEKIATIHKTSNLFSYKGNLRDVAVECGYMRSSHQYDEKISVKKYVN